MGLVPRNTWLAACIVSSINCVGMILQLQIIASVPNTPEWPALASAGIGFAVLMVLLIFRNQPRTKLFSCLYLVNTFSVATALFILNPYLLEGAREWFPFQPNKLGCMIAALTAPNLGIGLTALAVHVGSPLIQYSQFSEEIKNSIALGEPWATLIFGLAGLFTLIFKLQRMQFEQQYYKAQAEAATLRKMNQTFLDLRDRMNSPLQVIEISALLLSDGQTERRFFLDRIENSLKSLRDVNQILRDHQDKAS